MSRATNGAASRNRRRRRLDAAKGFRGFRSKHFRQATEKQEYRALWIVRTSAACRACGVTYSRLIEGLAKAKVALNRKMLSEIAIHDPEGFVKIVELAKARL